MLVPICSRIFGEEAPFIGDLGVLPVYAQYQ